MATTISIKQLDQEVSFEDLYQKLKHRVYSTVLSYLQQLEDAEEVTQDVFVEVHQKLATFKNESSVETWVYRIAINKSLDFLRYKNRKKRFAFFTSLYAPDSSEIKHDISHAQDPLQKIENKELAAQLRSAIDTLNEQQKTAIILIYVAQLPYKDAALAMDCSVKALESLVMRAKAKLKTQLESYNEGNLKNERQKK